MMVSQNLADLIYEPQIRIWSEFGFIFHDFESYRQNMENLRSIFHVYNHNINLDGFFSML